MAEKEEKGFFRTACQDLARIVSIMNLESTDVTKPRKMNSFWTNFKEKMIFFFRFFYLVFYKGFTPTIFDLLPFSIWYALTLAVYIYRATILPIILRVIGYGKYAKWEDLGKKIPKKDSSEAKPLRAPSLTRECALSSVDFGDPEFEKLLHALYNKTTHLSPHSQSPGHPLVAGFPGNFMNHLIGVYKALIAWNQPQFVVRGGFFHSVYGTFDYRAGCFDLREGRQELIDLIGPGAEELAFCICTSDRLGMLQDLNVAMYGTKNPNKEQSNGIEQNDGNPLPPLIGRLSAEGFPVRNHITQRYHTFPPELFAQFIVVVCADFMEQGALPATATRDNDICLFHFLRFRFFSDLLRYVSDHLLVVPPVFEKYLWASDFKEPSRNEIFFLIGIWKDVFSGSDRQTIYKLTSHEKSKLVEIMEKYPYLIEPHVALACSMEYGETIDGFSRKVLCERALQLIEGWGMLAYKKVTMKEVLHVIQEILNDE